MNSGYILLLLLLSFLILCISYSASADYLDSIREMDLRLLCLIVWFAPPVIVLLFTVGGLLFATGVPENRVLGRNMMLNALIGFIIVVGFLMVAQVVVPSIDIESCFSGETTHDGSAKTGIIIEAEGYFKKNEKVY